MENQQNSHQNVETELSRDLGLPTALAIGIVTMIAAGISTDCAEPSFSAAPTALAAILASTPLVSVEL